MSYPKVGAKAPDFAMSADDGSLVTSESLAGRRYVLYFYPKDDTAGCTAQACALRDNWSLAEALGRGDIGQISPGMAADIIAVSGDPLADVRRLETVDFVMAKGKVAKEP